MDTNIIYNEKCEQTMMSNIDEKSIDVILTSPPYCTSNRGGKNSKLNLETTTMKGYPKLRYDMFIDNMSTDEYV